MANDTQNQNAPRGSALSLKTYRAASGLLGPVADLALRQRLKQGKEDPGRVGERRGQATLPRPEGPMIWIHGASVGESLSVLPLVDRLCADLPGTHFLVTTGTVTSARLMAERLPDQAIHQFAPLDHPDYIAAFLDHWRPNACILVESELWPNLIGQTRGAGIPMALINGRISPKTYENWKQRPGAIAELLGAFDLLLAQDHQNAERFSALSGRTVPMLGNLKLAAPALPGDPAEIDALRAQIGDRPVWLAASTHPGEEDLILNAHMQVRQQYPELMLLLAPRHPERGDTVKTIIEGHGITTAMRSAHQPITPHTDVYLADTLGELGIFYRLSDIAFVGGSLTETGGHNPLEPARLGAAILYGPHTFNFKEVYQNMRASGGTALVRNERDLAAAIIRLITDVRTREAMAGRARSWAEDSAEDTLNGIVGALASIMPRQDNLSGTGG